MVKEALDMVAEHTSSTLALSEELTQKIRRSEARTSLRGALGIIIIIITFISMFLVQIPIEYKEIWRFVLIFIIIWIALLTFPCILFNISTRDVVALFLSVSPEKLVVGSNFTIAKKNNVFLFFKTCTDGIFLIRFRNAQEIQDVQVKLPIFIRKLSFKYELAGIRFAKKTGVYVIPVDEKTSLMGECIVYFTVDKKFLRPSIRADLLMQLISVLASKQ